MEIPACTQTLALGGPQVPSHCCVKACWSESPRSWMPHPGRRYSAPQQRRRGEAEDPPVCCDACLLPGIGRQSTGQAGGLHLSPYPHPAHTGHTPGASLTPSQIDTPVICIHCIKVSLND